MTRDELILKAIKALALLATLKQQGLPAEIQAHYEQLKEDLTPELPEPPNGVRWEDSDLAALADEGHAVMAEIRARHQAQG